MIINDYDRVLEAHTGLTRAQYECMLKWRGIQAPCVKCDGAGSFVYSNTATWRREPGTVAGRAMTRDVCDACWGSGDQLCPWPNLRELEEKARKLDYMLAQLKRTPKKGTPQTAPPKKRFVRKKT